MVILNTTEWGDRSRVIEVGSSECLNVFFAFIDTLEWIVSNAELFQR